MLLQGFFPIVKGENPKFMLSLKRFGFRWYSNREYGPSLVPDRRLSSLPSLGEEGLTFEVPVELVGEFYLNVAEDVFYYFLNIFGHFVWRLGISLYLCSVLSDYPLSMRGDWALSYRPIWLSSDSLFYCSIRFLNSL